MKYYSSIVFCLSSFEIFYYLESVKSINNIYQQKNVYFISEKSILIYGLLGIISLLIVLYRQVKKKYGTFLCKFISIISLLFLVIASLLYKVNFINNLSFYFNQNIIDIKSFIHIVGMLLLIVSLIMDNILEDKKKHISKAYISELLKNDH